MKKIVTVLIMCLWYVQAQAQSCVVVAKPDTLACGNKNIPLTGTVSGSVTSYGWTTSGSGTFVPSATVLNPTYVPGVSDQGSTVSLTLTGHTASSTCTDIATVNFGAKPSVDAGPPISVCFNNAVANVYGATYNNQSSILWTSSGTGTFANPSSYVPTYTPSTADIAAGQVKLYATVNGYGVCNPVKDSTVLTFFKPVVEINGPATVCYPGSTTSINLNATLDAYFPPGAGNWSSSGGGYFSSYSTTNTVYTPSASDKTAASIKIFYTVYANGFCNLIRDTLTVSFKGPTVNAGPDISACLSATSVSLTGTVTGATGGVWTSSGTGNFTPNNTSLTPQYNFSAGDYSLPSIVLKLTTTGNGICSAAQDSMIITFKAQPTVDAGPNQTICANVSSVALTGTVTGATGQNWTTSGTGTFSSSTALSPTYTPSAADKTAGTVILRITTTGNGAGCTAATDSMILTITPLATVNAGADKVVCGVAGAIVNITGTSSNAGGVLWTSFGTGTFSPNATSLSVQYTASAADLALGSIKIKLNSTGNSCNTAADTLNVSFTTPPTVDAGPNQSVCGTTSGVLLNGTITGAPGGVWSSSGTGTFSPNVNSLTAQYIPSAADYAAGSLTLSLTTLASGVCPTRKDSLLLVLLPAPVVNAGPDQTVCANGSGVALNGTVANATGAVWSSLGSGSFTPNASTLNATYNPSAADLAAGHVKLQLISTGGSCGTAIDTMEIFFNPLPTANAGPDLTVCFYGAPLNGSFTGAAGAVWSGGTGTFFPSDSSMSPSYHPGTPDLVNGYVVLYLTTIGNGPCYPAQDSILITFLPESTAEAGPDQTVCASNAQVALNGSVGGTVVPVWSTSGTGTFSPNVNALNAFYNPSAADLDSGTVVLTLAATGGMCNYASDSLYVYFVPSPQAFAGPNQTVCDDQSSIFLYGAAANASTTLWTTTGTGNFAFSPASLNNVYVPSPSDITAGTIYFTLHATGASTCPSDSSMLSVQFIHCQDSCTSQLSVVDSLYGKTFYADAFVTPSVPGYYNWSFGDGSYEYGPHVVHTYANSGTYSVCLDFMSQDSVCHIQFCKTIKINKCYVGVSFTKEVHQDTVYFTATTTPPTPGNYYWDFGDGVIGRGQTVSHIYGNSGTFPVALSFYSTDNTCVCEAVATDSVRIRICPKIYFDQSVDGTTATFTAISNEPVNGTYYWDFGDGTYATGSNVIHHFPSVGTYTVTLELYAHNGACQCLCRSVYTHNVKLSNCSLEVSFTDTSNQNNVTFQAYPVISSGYYQWSFGDGTSATTVSPVISHTYALSGTYQVHLFVSDDSNPFDTCQASFTDSISVNSAFTIEAQTIMISPMPVLETLNYKIGGLTSGTAESVEILNSLGTVISHSENVTINAEGNSTEVASLTPGFYILKVYANGHIYSKQFLKN